MPVKCNSSVTDNTFSKFPKVVLYYASVATPAEPRGEKEVHCQMLGRPTWAAKTF